ncbi:hypothetical protein DSO57_1028729 [Entomophthora muscae]|uniref:Uncharacterized protein n=1 Tax=Entomophthora muscae TaxID=34485 RepID=A0ACC2UMD7_9FUNG|nr:hypothetical protein DSO57_1028729 [Entomophthora muscae]
MVSFSGVLKSIFKGIIKVFTPKKRDKASEGRKKGPKSAARSTSKYGVSRNQPASASTCSLITDEHESCYSHPSQRTNSSLGISKISSRASSVHEHLPSIVAPPSSSIPRGNRVAPRIPPVPVPKKIAPIDTALKEMVGWSKAHLEELIEWTKAERDHIDGQGFLDSKDRPQQLDIASTKVRIRDPRVSEFGKTLINIFPVNKNNEFIHYKVGGCLALFPIVKEKVSVNREANTQETVLAIILEIHEAKLVASVGNASTAFNYLNHDWTMQESNDVTAFSRMLKGLKTMRAVLKDYPPKKKTAGWLGSHELIPLLLAPSFPKEKKFICGSLSNYNHLQLHNRLLNRDQILAVLLALASQQAAVIHGPPGTGKTLTLVEIIYQLTNQGKKVLVCSPSHISLDNILKRVAEINVGCLRIGTPEKLTNPGLKKYLLASKIISSDKHLWDTTCEKMSCITQAITLCKLPEMQRKLNRELDKLKQSKIKEELKVGDSLIPKAQAVFCSLNACGGRLLKRHRFDVVVIDESSQALEPDCWLAISHADKVIFAGDHHQLPPVVKSTKTRLGVTLFESILNSNPGIVKMLTEQFRMNEKIMHYSSNYLYESQLFANAAVKSQLLNGLEGVASTAITTKPILFIDTAKSNLGEAMVGFSKYNPGEITLVVQHIQTLVEAGVKQSCIAVISPYNAQVLKIKKRIANAYPEVRVSSVDGFQGSEQDAIIVSMVRSNTSGQVGFLQDYRRLNVAITRARRHLCVIGNSKTLSSRQYSKRNISSHSGFLIGFVGYLTPFKLKE